MSPSPPINPDDYSHTEGLTSFTPEQHVSGVQVKRNGGEQKRGDGGNSNKTAGEEKRTMKI